MNTDLSDTPKGPLEPFLQKMYFLLPFSNYFLDVCVLLMHFVIFFFKKTVLFSQLAQYIA